VRKIARMDMQTLFMGLVIGGLLIGGAVFLFTQQAIVLEEEAGVSGTAKWNFYIKDKLNEGAGVTDGDVYIYDMDRPTELVETIAVSSGVATSTQAYTTGDLLFVKYIGDGTPGTHWLDYGMQITIPKLDREYDSVPTLDVADEDWIYVYKWADLTGTDVDGLKNGAVVFEDGTAGVNAFNVTTDTDPKLGVMLTNEDDDTAYVDPRGWIDYSTDVPELRNRGAWLIINFEPTGTTISGIDANDYLRFKSIPSGMQKIKMATSLVLAFPLNTEFLAGARDVNTAGNPVSGLDGQGVTIFTVILDFTGAISTALGSDDIDIEISLVSSYSLDYLDEFDTLSQAGDNPIGEILSAWTNDWSMGGTAT